MKINRFKPGWPCCRLPNVRSCLIRIHIIIFIIAIFTIQVNASAGYAQKITITKKDVSLTAILMEIRQQSGYDLIYDVDLVRQVRSMDVNVHNADLKEVLEICLKDQPFAYSIADKTIVIKEKSKGMLDNAFGYLNAVDILCRVVSEKGKPISGANITVKEKKSIARSNDKGEFTVRWTEGQLILMISYVGYKTKEVVVTGQEAVLVITMEEEAQVMQDVVITGMFERKKASFTGSTRTVTGEQLRTVGNQNIIQSLRSLDPSFIIVDNNLLGSDPNALARIELRGKTSFTQNTNMGTLTDAFAVDPNSPLFILDGFESTLRQITDLDINRISSITILKDAASTALYGARSANGVIVVETIRPKPGELRINYTGDFSMAVPDLRDYNLMNSEEKVRFELLAGRYIDRNFLTGGFPKLDRLYNQRLKAVREGVDTYWLKEPLRSVGFTHKHSVYASGGSEEFQYGVGVNLQNVAGLMKGSARKNWEGRIDLAYRKGKFNLSNRTFISGSKADESPYGSFSTYARINPYYKKNINGKYVEQVPNGFTQGTDTTENIANPLYNARLNSENYTEGLSIQNNLGFNLNLNKSLRLSGALQLSKDISTAIEFISPLNTDFDNTAILEKGRYTNAHMEGFTYNGNIGAAYQKTIKEKHVLVGNVRAEVQETQKSFLGLSAVGFPYGVKGIPSFAYSYQPNAKPQASLPPKVRRLNALASINYVYDNRYFLDATYRIDGSTAFGTSKKHSTFWSTGLGWSMHNEPFLKGADWISSLILRGNIGITGNQNFGSFASATIYNLEANSNYFGQGLYHTSLGNPNLDWQKTLNRSAGLDLSMFNNRAGILVEFYNKQTDPLIITIDVPGSNGISQYPMNAGRLNVKSLEADLKYSPIFNVERRIIWTLGVMGSMYKSKYSDFGNVLNSLNTEQQRSNSIQRFADGRSPDDLWAVRSLGIDPGSGREVFIKKDGTYTFDYNADDIQAIANGRPKVEGVISSNLRLRNLTLSVFMRYNIGSSRLNNALFDKVENMSFSDLAFNQDKRALELRWKQPGDLAQFKNISLAEVTPISSRFIQKESFLTGESFSVGYELTPATSPWLKSMHLQNLRFTAFANNIFRLSNIVSERGIDYPFANSVSFTVNASF